jgi:hypothetical protein
MAALSDPKLEAFAQALLKNIATGMARGKAATAAAHEAGYVGSSIADNARKRANRADVKARMIELAGPAQVQAEAEVVATVEDALDKLGRIASVNPKPNAIKPTDQIAALHLMAKIKGWLAPKPIDVTTDGNPLPPTPVGPTIIITGRPDSGTRNENPSGSEGARAHGGRA